MMEDYKPQFLPLQMELIDTFQDIFNKGDNIRKAYETFESENFKTRSDQRDLQISKSELNLKNIRFDKKALEFYNDNSTLVGLDLPVFFSKNNSNNQRSVVMIIALDPLRKFPNNLESVQVGYSFAFHMNCMRKEQSYWQIVTDITSKDFDVYVTDLYKIWMSKKGEKKYNFSKEKNPFNKILEKEIEIIKPESFIIFGKEAELAVSSIGINDNRLDFPHPSNMANRGWQKRFNQKCTFANKSAYIIEELLKKTNKAA